VWKRYRLVARDSSTLIVRGTLERSPEGVINLIADGFESLALSVRATSRDFR
jgi:error-prone DNA polymerase